MMLPILPGFPISDSEGFAKIQELYQRTQIFLLKSSSLTG